MPLFLFTLPYFCDMNNRCYALIRSRGNMLGWCLVKVVIPTCFKRESKTFMDTRYRHSGMTMEGCPINLVPACHSVKAFECKLERGTFGHDKAKNMRKVR